MKNVPLLHMDAIDKVFPGVHALNKADFLLDYGEIHALLGENGAGKSTLMKILSGSLRKDGGRIVIEGKEVHIDTPARAREFGIGMVYQELSLVPSLSVAENISLGRLPVKKSGLIDWDSAFTEAEHVLESLGLNVDPSMKVGTLGMAERQLLEIAKVISQHVQILILDEPTSALTETERDRLFDVVRRLRDRGVSVIYISHRLAEVMEIADRATILRDGRNVGTYPIDEVDENHLARLMVGREVSEQFPGAGRSAANSDEAIAVKDVCIGEHVKDLTFCVHKGEILGIFGLMGSGRSTVAQALFGMERIDSGEVQIGGENVSLRSPRDAIDAGIAYLTEDRRDGLVPIMGVTNNITLASLKNVSKSGLVDHRTERELAGKYVKDLKINTPNLSQRVHRLSGGNQQKVVLAKWLCSNSKILIFHEPTRGIDVGAKAEVFQLMRNLADRGAAIIMISSEMPEILGMCDRILVMSKGKVVAEYGAGEATQEDLLKSASGIGGNKR